MYAMRLWYMLILTQIRADSKILLRLSCWIACRKQFPRSRCTSLPGVLRMSRYFLPVSLDNDDNNILEDVAWDVVKCFCANTSDEPAFSTWRFARVYQGFRQWLVNKKITCKIMQDYSCSQHSRRTDYQILWLKFAYLAAYTQRIEHSEQ